MGRNGGQIVNGLNASLQTIDKRYGKDTATFVADLVQEGGNIIRERVKIYDIQCDLKEKNIFTGLRGAHVKELEERMKLWAGYGINNQEMLDKNQLREHIDSDFYEGALIPTDACVEDIRYILDYYRLSGDKRLLWGGGTVYGGTDPNNIEAKLRRNMDKVFPQLKGVKIDYAWSGNFALSFSRVPYSVMGSWWYGFRDRVGL